MTKKLDLTKISENLTPKERAKLVISLQNKSIGEALKSKDFGHTLKALEVSNLDQRVEMVESIILERKRAIRRR